MLTVNLHWIYRSDVKDSYILIADNCILNAITPWPTITHEMLRCKAPVTQWRIVWGTKLIWIRKTSCHGGDFWSNNPRSNNWFYELERCDTMLRINNNWCILDLIDLYQFLRVTTSKQQHGPVQIRNEMVGYCSTMWYKPTRIDTMFSDIGMRLWPL